MSAQLTVTADAVTPAKVRRQPREQQLRGPQARPQRVGAPATRPVQPLAPGAGTPVALQLPSRPARVERRCADQASGSLRLTDRGLLVVMVVLAALALATVTVGVAKFSGVSNAPLDERQSAHGSSIVLQR